MWTRRPRPDPPPPFDPADPAQLARRAAVWRAMAELFLDTPMEAADHALAARVLAASGYAPAELDAILRDEVAPVFYGNLLVVAGQWGAWDPAFVRDAVLAHVARPRRDGPLAVWLRARRAGLVRADWAAVRARLAEARG